MTATGYFGIRAKITIVDRTLRLTRPNGNGYGEEQYKEKCPSKDVEHVDQRENKNILHFCAVRMCTDNITRAKLSYRLVFYFFYFTHTTVLQLKSQR